MTQNACATTRLEVVLMKATQRAAQYRMQRIGLAPGNTRAASARLRWLRGLMTAALAVVLLGCAPVDEVPAAQTANDSAPQAATRAPRELTLVNGVDYACSIPADCTIKDVGNCCGYYPACVNVDSPTFPDRVKAECAASGTSAVCGFPSISECDCIEGRCTGLSGLRSVIEQRED
jgi:hypothetical protein